METKQNTHYNTATGDCWTKDQGMEALVTRHRPGVAPYSPSTTYQVKTLPCTGVGTGDCWTQEQGRRPRCLPGVAPYPPPTGYQRSNVLTPGPQ